MNTRTFNHTLALIPLMQFIIKVTETTTSKTVQKFKLFFEKNNLQLSQAQTDENGTIIIYASDSVMLSLGDIIIVKTDPNQEKYFQEKQRFTLNTPITQFEMKLKPQKQYSISFYIQTGPNCPIQSVITILQNGTSLIQNTTVNCRTTFKFGESSSKMKLGQTYQWTASASGYVQQQGSFTFNEINNEIIFGLLAGSGISSGVIIAIAIGSVAIVLIVCFFVYFKCRKSKATYDVVDQQPLLAE